MTRFATVLFGLALLGCATEPEKAPCDHLFDVPVEYQVNASGTLEAISFSWPRDCRGDPVRLSIPRWWKEGACGVVVSRREPTYAEGAEPARRSTVFVYDTERPNLVRARDEKSDAKPTVVDQSLDRLPTPGDTLRICDGELAASS